MLKRIIENPVPLELRRVYLERDSGELAVRGENFEKVLYFSDGQLVFAKTNVLHERIGEILFKLGKIDRSQFWNIHQLLGAKKDKIGKILVQERYISQQDLFLGLMDQIRVIAVSTFTLANGEWEFVSTRPQLGEDSRLVIELPEIFLEGVSRFKNMAFFKNSKMDLLLAVKPVPEDIRHFLDPESLKFLGMLSQSPNLPSEQIAGRLSYSEDFFWQKLFLFYLLHLVDFSEQAPERELDKNIEELIALYERLKRGETNYYEILGLSPRVTVSEIKTAYFEYAKKFHPDRLSQAPDPDLKEKANFVFARINRAFDVLSTENKRFEYDTKGFQETSDEDRLNKNLVEKANMIYRKARTLYNQKRYWEAATMLEEAVRLDNSRSAYILLLGLSQMNLPNLMRRAEKNLQRVIGLEPWNAEPYVALGMLFLSEKLEKRAEGFFRKALSINPDHALARKKLEEITGPVKKGLFSSVFKKK